MNSNNLLFSLVHATQVQKYLESRNVAVEPNFAFQQALLGGMTDNPWMYAFLSQGNFSRLDPLGEVAAKLEKANVEVSRLEGVTLGLQGQLTTANDSVTTLESVKLNLQGQLDTANASVQTLGTAKNALQAQLDTANASVTTLETEKDALQALLDLATTGTNAELIAAIQALQANLNAATTTIATLESAKNELQSKLDAAIARIAELEAEKLAWAAQWNIAKDTIKALEDEKLALKAQLDAAADNTVELEAARDALQNELTAAHANLANLEISKLDLEGQLTDAKIGLDILQAEKQNLQTQLDFAFIKSAELETEQAALKSQLNDNAASISNLEAAKNELEAQLNLAQTSIAELTALNAAVQAERDAAKAKVAILEEANRALLTELNAAKNSVTELSTLTLALQAELDAARAEAATQAAAKAEMERHLQAARAELDALKNLNADLTLQLMTALTDLESSSNAFQTQVDALTNQVAGLGTERSILLENLQAALHEKQVFQQESAFWKKASTSVWSKLAGEIGGENVFVAIEDGKIILTGLPFQGTADAQNFKSGYLGFLRHYFENEGIPLPPLVSALETSWENVTNDLHRKEVFITLEGGKVVLMGLQLQGTPNSKDFKPGFLGYVRRYFDNLPAFDHPAAEAALKNWTNDLQRKEVAVRIEDAKVILAGLKLPTQSDSKQFKNEYLAYVRRYFETEDAPKTPVEILKETAPVTKGKTAATQAIAGKQNLPEKTAPDDLAQILGIGKIIRDLLAEHGISTFRQLSAKTEKEIDAILATAGVSLGLTHPTAWIEQARLLADGKLEEWEAWKKIQK